MRVAAHSADNCPLLTGCSVVPETKGKSLEQLSRVFCISTFDHAKHGLEEAKVFFKKCWSPRSGHKWPVLGGEGGSDEGMEFHNLADDSSE